MPARVATNFITQLFDNWQKALWDFASLLKLSAILYSAFKFQRFSVAAFILNLPHPLRKMLLLLNCPFKVWKERNHLILGESVIKIRPLQRCLPWCPFLYVTHSGMIPTFHPRDRWDWERIKPFSKDQSRGLSLRLRALYWGNFSKSC